MKYLMFDTEIEAIERSAAAWLVVRTPQPGDTTIHMWSWLVHYLDGRVAMQIPDTPGEAQVLMSQEDYDALLTPEERSLLIDNLPPDWNPPDET